MGKRSKRIRTSSGHCEPAAPFSLPTEKSDAIFEVRLAFAIFLISAALDRSDTTPSFYTIRGVHKWSLSLHLCMLPREYCALLIACDLVEVRKSALGGTTVHMKNDQWKSFIERYIQKDNKIGESLCEFTDRNTIYIDALKDGAKKVKWNDKIHPSRQMALLRVGAYAVAGERVKSTLQINDCSEPPPFDHRTRTMHRRLTNKIRHHIKDIYTGDDIKHVMKWLEMEDLLGSKDDKKKAPPSPPPPPTKPTSINTNNSAEPGSEYTGPRITPRTFLAGDIAFLSAMLGREGYEGWWCMWCWLMKPDYQTGLCRDHGNPLHTECTSSECTHHQGLNIQDIINQHEENVSKKLKSTARKGVAMRPMLNKNTTVLGPGLHLMMGIADMLITYHFDMIDEHVEPLSRDELATRESIPKNEEMLAEEKIALAVWNDSIDGGVKWKQLIDESKKLEKKIEESNGDTRETLVIEKKDKDDRIKALKMAHDNRVKKIEALKADIDTAQKSLEKCRKDRKISNKSIYNKCEEILKRHGIERGSYHGRKFNGVNIVKMMNQAKAVYDEMEQLILNEGRATDGSVDSDVIKSFCKDVRLGLQNLDAIFARISDLKTDMNNEYCNETQEMINLAMEHMRKLKFSITPKLHAMECHIVHQMRTVPGFAHMLEQWIEHYHQIGHRLDVRWQCQQLGDQARLRASKEKALQHPDSKQAALQLKEFRGVKKRKRKEESVESENGRRQARKDAFAELFSHLNQTEVDQDVEMEAVGAETEVQDGAETEVVDGVVVETGVVDEYVVISSRGRRISERRRFECEG